MKREFPEDSSKREVNFCYIEIVGIISKSWSFSKSIRYICTILRLLDRRGENISASSLLRVPR